MIHEVVQPIILLFIVMDPIGNAPLFYVLTKDLNAGERRSIVNYSVFVATIILLIFALIGDLVMGYLDITTNDFKIAAGLVLLIYSILGFLEAKPMPKHDKKSLAIVPLATPLLAGPGAIASVIYIKYTWGLYIAIVSTIIASTISLLILHMGQFLDHVLGRNGALILDKIMMLLMAAYAISIVRSGILDIVRY